MPVLSRFYGIVIRMYAEINVPHNTPHFHAYYQGAESVYGIDPVDQLAGSLPRRQQRLVEAWAELHAVELAAAWNRLQAGQKPDPIAPLD